MQSLDGLSIPVVIAYIVIAASGATCIALAFRRALTYKAMFVAGVVTALVDGFILHVSPAWLSMDVTFALYPLVRIGQKRLRSRRP